MQVDHPLLVGRRQLRRHLARWHAIAPDVLRGGSPLALHALRVTARRLVAALQWLAALPVDDAAGLATRVRRVLSATGPARDLDIRLAELTAAPDAGRALEPLLQPLRLDQGRRQASLRRTLGSAATARLFAAVHQLDTRPGGTVAARSVTDVARPLVVRRYRRLRQAARHAVREPDPSRCHAMRLQAKKLRYLLEILAKPQRRPLRRYLRRLRRLQALLGRIHDAHQSLEWIRLHARRHRSRLGTDGAVVVARIRDQQARRLARDVAALPRAWRRASGRHWRRLRRSLRR